MPYDLAIPLLDIYLKNSKIFIHKDLCTTPHVHCSIIHGGQDMEKTRMSFNRGLDKEDVVHVYYGILLSHRKDEILPFMTTWMGLENIMLSKISQSEKAKNHMISLICGI